MNSSMVKKIVSIVPQRSARLQSGTPFAPARMPASNDTRMAHLANLLHWLTPLNAMSKDDQRELGILGAQGRLARQDDDEDTDGEPDREDPAASAAGLHHTVR
jgi:hypothetical protein